MLYNSNAYQRLSGWTSCGIATFLWHIELREWLESFGELVIRIERKGKRWDRTACGICEVWQTREAKVHSSLGSCQGHEALRSYQLVVESGVKSEETCDA